MNTAIFDEKKLNIQYITDKNAQRSAVILPLTQFEALLTQITTLNQEVARLETEMQQPRTQTTVPNSSDEPVEQKMVLYKHYYELLNQILTDLQHYKEVKTELDRKIHLQRVVTTIESSIQEARSQLGELKKKTKPATLHGVPPHPDFLITQSQPFEAIKTQLLATVTDSQRPPLLIQAPSGMGKSVLATLLTEHDEVRHAFPDGIFWLRLGQEPLLLDDQFSIIQTLEPSIKGIIDIEEGSKLIKELCATRACLLILDDVWDAQDVLAFNLVGENSQLLITTAESSLLDILKYFIATTKDYALHQLSEAQAHQFFLHYSGQKQAPSTLVEAIVHACEQLPLALKLVAHLAQNQPPNQWQALVERLTDQDYELPNHQYPSALMRALHLNVEALGEQADYYLALAVFSDYVRIPKAPIIMLWRYLYQLSEEQCHHFLNELAASSLLTLQEDYISLHSFQHSYLTAEADLDKLHNHLLAGYRRYCGQHGWLNGPHDGYFFEHLSMHLVQAGRSQELKSLLLDFDWIDKKLHHTSVHAVLTDYELLEHKEIEILKKTLYEAAPILINNKAQLATQLLDRLWGNKSLKDNKDIQALLNQAKEAAPHWQWQPHFPE